MYRQAYGGSMLSNEELMFALEDARCRHAATIELIYHTDQQAMNLLSHYATLGVAAAAGVAAALGNSAIVPPTVGVAMFGAAVSLFVGATYCFRAMESGNINLPGRDPDFWQWAINNNGVSIIIATNEYLKNLQEMGKINAEMSDRTARSLRRAKWWGMATIPISLTIGIIAWFPSLESVASG